MLAAGEIEVGRSQVLAPHAEVLVLIQGIEIADSLRHACTARS